MKRSSTCLILYSLIFFFLAVRATLRVGFFNVLYINISDLLSSYFLAYLAMMVLYFYLLYCWHKYGEFPQKWIGLTFIVISLCAIFIPPSSSCDLYYYISYSVIQGKLGLNPYLHSISELSQNSSLSFSQVTGFPLYTPMTYGYIVAFGLKILYHLSFGNEIVIYLLIKLIFAGSLYLIYIYLRKIMEHFQVKGRGFLGLAFLLNPVIHIQYIINGHNDVILCLFICMALYYLFRKNYILAFILLSLSVHVKLTSLFIIPMVLVYCVKKKAGALQILIGGLLFLISFFPYLFLYGLKSLPPGIVQYRTSFDVGFFTCLHYILKLSANVSTQRILDLVHISPFVWMVFFWIGLILYYREKRPDEIRMCRYLEALYLIYLTFFSNVIYPWYFLWLAPFICCTREFKAKLALYTIIFFVLELYFGFIYYFLFLHTGWYQPSVLIIYLLCVGIYLVYPKVRNSYTTINSDCKPSDLAQSRRS